VDVFSHQDAKTEKTVSIPGATVLDEEVLAMSSTAKYGDEWRAGLGWASPALLIFTSGTTGLPKAATCNHGRVGFSF
jgi:acyl-coenzyme A synthetase/AMP-(fatty) acid ligase